jgi:hypothetical protein
VAVSDGRVASRVEVDIRLETLKVGNQVGNQVDSGGISSRAGTLSRDGRGAGEGSKERLDDETHGVEAVMDVVC